MNFKEYQKGTHETAVYPEERALDYLILKLVSEVGEIAGHVGKYYRGDYDEHCDYLGVELPDILEYEIGDVQWYLSELCTHLGLDLGRVAKNNLKKLADRAERGVLKGSGDKR